MSYAYEQFPFSFEVTDNILADSYKLQVLKIPSKLQITPL